MTIPSSPALRGELKTRSLEKSTTIEDPLTGRQFQFDDLQAEVLALMDGQRTSEEIAGEVLGDPAAAPTVDSLLARLEDFGLIAQEQALSSQELAQKQARALRPAAKRTRERKVVESVRWAAENLPFYATHLSDQASNFSKIEDLAELPFTRKNDVRSNFPAGLIPESEALQDLVERGAVSLSTTSGSTGGRLQYIYNLERRVSASMGRHATYNDEFNTAVFTTPICNGQLCHRGGIPFEERLVGDTSLLLNSSERIMQLEKQHLEEILADVDRHDARVLSTDPVYGAALVRAFERLDMKLPSFEKVITGWEYLTHQHKRILGKAFGVPVYPTYGATDIGGGAAITCEHDRYHVVQDFFYFEFVRDGRPVESGEIGEIVVTSLNHPYTRLIRYRVGDLARPIESCGCSWDDYQCFEIEGRVQDTLFATDGTPVTSRAVDDLFSDLAWLDFYQLVQHEKDVFQLLAVRGDTSREKADEATFLERLGQLLGADANIRIRYVRELPIEQSLKYPMTKRKTEAPFSEW